MFLCGLESRGGLKHLLTEEQEAGWSNVFGEGIGDDVMGALVLRLDLIGFVGPADMVVFEVDMPRF